MELVPGALTDEVLGSLCEWAKSRHYAFLRFSHTDPDLLQRLATIVSAQHMDCRALYLGYGAGPFELVIDQQSERSGDAGRVST